MSACAEGPHFLPAPPGPNSRSHLCYSTDSNVCPSKTRAIKGSFQSHCRRNVNMKGRPVGFWGGMSPLGLSKGCQKSRSLRPRLAWTTNMLYYLWHISYLLWAFFSLQYKERVGLNLKTLKGSSMPEMFTVLCCGSWGHNPQTAV